MMAIEEKKLTAITFRCSDEFEKELAGVAEAFGMRESEFIRVAIEEKVKAARCMYESLHQVSWRATTTRTDDV